MPRAVRGHLALPKQVKGNWQPRQPSRSRRESDYAPFCRKARIVDVEEHDILLDGFWGTNR